MSRLLPTVTLFPDSEHIATISGQDTVSIRRQAEPASRYQLGKSEKSWFLSVDFDSGLRESLESINKARHRPHRGDLFEPHKLPGEQAPLASYQDGQLNLVFLSDNGRTAIDLPEREQQQQFFFELQAALAVREPSDGVPLARRNARGCQALGGQIVFLALAGNCFNRMLFVSPYAKAPVAICHLVELHNWLELLLGGSQLPRRSCSR